MIHVLAVEDSRTQGAALSNDLRAAGFRVSLVDSGPAALETLETDEVDLIVSDVVMPGMTGYELCRRVKDDPVRGAIPVILLTSLTDPLDVVSGLEAGADNFLRKPYQAAQLVARCRAAVDNRQLREYVGEQAGVRLSFGGRHFDITAGRQQMLDLLISTFEELVETSREVRARGQQLVRLHGQLERQLQTVDLERKRLEAVVASVPVPLFVIGPDGLVSHASAATGLAFGRTPAQILGRDLDEILHFVDSDGRPLPPGTLPHHTAVRERRTVSAGAAFDVFLAGADRTRLPVVLEASPVLDDQARTAGCVATAHVVGALTQHDPLTGLPNSAAYLDRAARTLGSHRQGCAIMLIELDRFDLVRAAIGNTASDALLVEASRRLREVFEPTQEGGRATDCFLGYLGGSQFGTIILAPLADSFSALHLAESARRMLSAPYPEHDGIHVRTSIGVAMDNQAHKGQQLFLAATTALRRAQEAGGGRVEILGEAASEQAMNQLRLEIDLRAAVDGGAVQLHYQPEIDLRTGRLLGFEALARWQHARLGAISPARFIGLAEESGMIESLGRDLLRLGCTQARTWQERHRAPELSIAVNISAKQLRAGFVAEVTDVLTDTGLEPTSLVLEVTETAAMSDPESTVSILDELRDHGVRFALDDFGTGYSSLAYLTRMRFDQLKLDRGFVEGMRTGGPDAVVAQSIIALGHSLDIPVLAEGIEHREQAEMLIELGCEQGQGYLFSRPLSPESAGMLLDQVRDDDYVVEARDGPSE